MNINLTSEEVSTLLTSIEYAKDCVRNAQDASVEVRRATLDRLDSVATKLRSARQRPESS